MSDTFWSQFPVAVHLSHAVSIDPIFKIAIKQKPTMYSYRTTFMRWHMRQRALHLLVQLHSFNLITNAKPIESHTDTSMSKVIAYRLFIFSFARYALSRIVRHTIIIHRMRWNWVYIGTSTSTFIVFSSQCCCLTEFCLRYGQNRSMKRNTWNVLFAQILRF